MRDTVGDIDLLVAADEDPESVMDHFCTMPLVDRVLAHGPTKSSVVTTKGIQVDIRVVPAAVWGAALQYFTGSKAHNIRIRELAVRAGLKLSEYGLFRVDNNKLLASTDEAEIYAKLGLPWIPPTLREDRGEVEAALDGHLPDLVEVADIVGDLHMHTDLTDGLADLDDMVAAASRHGYRYCAITDHAPLLAMQRMTRDKALRQRSELPEAARRHGIAVLHGSELNIAADGSLDWDDDFLAGFDILVASVHSDFDQTREEMTRRLITAIEHPYVNIIGHPTTRLLGRRPPIDFDVDAVFAAAARTHTALEINAFPDRLDLNDELRAPGPRTWSCLRDRHRCPRGPASGPHPLRRRRRPAWLGVRRRGDQHLAAGPALHLPRKGTPLTAPTAAGSQCDLGAHLRTFDPRLAVGGVRR